MAYVHNKINIKKHWQIRLSDNLTHDHRQLAVLLLAAVIYGTIIVTRILYLD